MHNALLQNQLMFARNASFSVIYTCVPFRRYIIVTVQYLKMVVGNGMVLDVPDVHIITYLCQKPKTVATLACL